jgi:hypothetical protein
MVADAAAAVKPGEYAGTFIWNTWRRPVSRGCKMNSTPDRDVRASVLVCATSFVFEANPPVFTGGEMIRCG